MAEKPEDTPEEQASFAEAVESGFAPLGPGGDSHSAPVTGGDSDSRLEPTLATVTTVTSVAPFH